MSVKHDAEKNGGAAFPFVCTDDWRERADGMTLRDYFAGQALSFLAGGDFEVFDHLASDAYAIADAMIAARKGGEA